MVPFANRLSLPHLPLGDGRAEFDINWPSENIAMHGVAFTQVWDVDEASSNNAKLQTTIADALGTHLGSARLHLSLSDTSGLTLSLSYTHEHLAPMAAGVGLHPWFHAPPDEEQISLGFTADGQFEMGPDQFPIRHFDLDEPTRHLLDRTKDGLDTCFTGWNGLATVNRPDAKIEIGVEANSALLHCFISRQFQSICVEPVTHAPNVVHDRNWQHLGDMTVLNAQQSVSTEMKIAAIPLARTK